jgi:hypothetical protein
MDSLAGLRTTYQPSRRGFLITMTGAGIILWAMLGRAWPPWNSPRREPSG